ncbi:MAG: protoporphyrinogen oxidase HemJ [Robiginitomaculum sp.]
MLYLWIKALHIISVIFWMAGLMYLPRLYVYHSKAVPGGEQEMALLGQERRLLKIIMTPAMLSALVFGLILVWHAIHTGTYGHWLSLKLALVTALMAYHGIMSADRKKFAGGERPRSEKTYRILNEVPALIIIAVVILAVVKPF